jgi:hypothetical protein
MRRVDYIVSASRRNAIRVPPWSPADPVKTKDQTSDPQLIGPRASSEKSRAVANWIRGDEPGSDGFPIVLAPIPCYPTDSIDLARRIVRSSKPTVGAQAYQRARRLTHMNSPGFLVEGCGSPDRSASARDPPNQEPSPAGTGSTLVVSVFGSSPGRKRSGSGCTGPKSS